MIVVDTSALVALLLPESDWQVFDAITKRNECLLPATCLLEVSMVLSTRKPLLTSSRFDEFLMASRIGIASITPELARAARDAFLVYGKGRHPAGLNFGDCFSYALAKQLDAPLLFKGTDFGQTDVRVVALESEQP